MAIRLPAALAALLVLGLLPGNVRADNPKAEDLIPFEKLEVKLRNELWRVTQRYTIRRSVEDVTVRCHTESYGWLLKHLALASVASRKLDLGKYVIEDKDDGTFSIDDRDGAFAACERAWTEEGRAVIVARGHIEGALLPKVKGTGVIVVRYREETKDEKAEREARAKKDDKEPEPGPHLFADCRIFFRVEDDFLHLASQAFRRTLGKLLGDKMEGLVNCAAKVAEVVDRDPKKVWDAIQNQKLPAAELEEFSKKFLVH